MVRASAVALVVAVSAALVALPASGAQAPPRAPTLKLASLAPLTVTGRSFGPHEKLLLIYRGEDGASRVASARATRLGRFRAVFRIRLHRCDSFVVRAAGVAGSRAVLQVERDCKERRGPPERASREKRRPRDGG